MTMQTSFDRAVIEGVKMPSAATATVAEPKSASHHVMDDEEKAAELEPQKTPQNPPPTVQDNGRHSGPKKKADSEKPVNNWVCLASALNVLPLDAPTRTRT
ncbi:hypothetical protein [Aporhodopirellula rubra]|uniref:hypothetical protein n=1 Tax=Aporhodopirellula rubra TaxID=980271 RepID=UPI001622E40E|nr:hypothetical protein [Aporhodopirellula rubra]